MSGAAAAPRLRSSVVHDSGLAGRILRFHHAVAGPGAPMEAQVLWSGVLFDLVNRHAEHPPGRAPRPQRSGPHRPYRGDPARACPRRHQPRRRGRPGRLVAMASGSFVPGCERHLASCLCARMPAAPCQGLIDAGESLAMAAAAAGFADQSHFSRNFVRAYGFTPGSYRRPLGEWGKIIQYPPADRPWLPLRPVTACLCAPRQGGRAIRCRPMIS